MPSTCQVRTYFLQMSSRPESGQDAALPDGWRTVQRVRPTADDYRRLYNGVGAPWRWFDRNLMADDLLLAAILDPRVEIHGIEYLGREAGYIELDGRAPGEVEIAYFGLFPEFLGRGAGLAFLRWGIHRAWRMLDEAAASAAQPAAPRSGGDPVRPRVWVHTCEWDHPAALAIYRQAGFEQYDERMLDQQLPEA